MKFTQEQLESMSDLELNLITSKLLGVINATVNHKRLFGAVKRWGVTNITTHIDYCNKWSDCGALIDELTIEKYGVISIDKSILIFTNASDSFSVKHENIKRAVTIVYILTKQSNG